MIKVGIHGANGKMGKMIAECLKDSQIAIVNAKFDKDDVDLENFFNDSEVIIDFSSKEGTMELLNFALHSPKPLCIGTTGLGEDGMAKIRECSEKMPILYATNTSLGIAVLNRLAATAAAALREFDIEITEMHHKHKKDAPSGTALTLGESVAKARNLDLKEKMITSRNGITGERNADDIAILALRGGDIVGRHTVGFYNDGEFIELKHTATSRATFAKGAIKAAIWISAQKNGLYTIDDCLFG